MRRMDELSCAPRTLQHRRGRVGQSIYFDVEPDAQEDTKTRAEALTEVEALTKLEVVGVVTKVEVDAQVDNEVSAQAGKVVDA